jgi:hypothetical protein
MKNFRLFGLMLFILMMGNSCKTYISLEKVEPRSDSDSIAEQVQKLEPGDLIQIWEKSGSFKMMQFVSTEEGVIRGFSATGNAGDPVSIRLEDIVKIKVKKVSVGKTVLLTGGIVASVLLVYYIAAVIFINAAFGS